MNKYKNGKIYKITHPQTDKVYIGSTIKELKHRFKGHKAVYKGCVDGKKKYPPKSVEILKLGPAECEISLIENFPCSSNKELLEREQFNLDKDEYYIKCVNRNKAYRTNEQIFIDKIRFCEYNKYGYAFCTRCYLEGHSAPYQHWYKSCDKLYEIRDGKLFALKLHNNISKSVDKISDEIIGRRHLLIEIRKKGCEEGKNKDYLIMKNIQKKVPRWKARCPLSATKPLSIMVR